MKRFCIMSVAALVTLAFGLHWNDLFPPAEKVRPIEPVKVLPQQHVFVHDVGGNGRSARFELVGMTPTIIKSPMMGVNPSPKMDGSIYVFKNRALQLRNGSPDKITMQVAGGFLEAQTVILEIPEGIPVFLGKKGDPPKKK
ncbi:MAG: hypothetical protein HOO67_01210 [Candidatus Peribacteraceae bacterium]|nr:hypothetical protein [Candidatus Peribacteraceae bacterium]